MSTITARQFYRDGRPVDGQPASLAGQTQWLTTVSSQKPGRAFVICRLDAQHWSLRHGAFAPLLGAVPIVIGVLVCSRFWPLLFEPGRLVAGLFLEALGAFALWIGLSSIWKSFDTIELDKAGNRIYASRRIHSQPPAVVRDAARLLSDARAVQLIAKLVKGTGANRQTTIGHEINLVMGDGSRINLVDGKSRDASMADAQALAEFLSVPLWQMTDL